MLAFPFLLPELAPLTLMFHFPSPSILRGTFCKYLHEILTDTRVAPLYHEIAEKKQTQLPEPGATNTPEFRNIIFESCFHIPRSPFGHVSLDLPCPEIACGTLHLVPPPLVQLMPKTARWCGQIVIDSILSLDLSNHATRDKMRSISSLILENLCEDKCLVISFEHDNKEIILVWRVFDPWHRSRKDYRR